MYRVCALTYLMQLMCYEKKLHFENQRILKNAETDFIWSDCRHVVIRVVVKSHSERPGFGRFLFCNLSGQMCAVYQQRSGEHYLSHCLY